MSLVTQGLDCFFILRHASNRCCKGSQLRSLAYAMGLSTNGELEISKSKRDTFLIIRVCKSARTFNLPLE